MRFSSAISVPSGRPWSRHLRWLVDRAKNRRESPVLSVIRIGANPLRVAAGSMVGVADRVRRPVRAAIDAVAASWTIGSVDDGTVSIGLCDGLAWQIEAWSCRAGRRARASGPPRLSAAREAPPRCRAAAPLLIMYGRIRQRIAVTAASACFRRAPQEDQRSLRPQGRSMMVLPAERQHDGGPWRPTSRLAPPCSVEA